MDIPGILTIFISLIALIDPLGTVGFFLAITCKDSPAVRKHTALLGCVYAFCILILFLGFGGSILSFFGITVSAVQVGGGLILAKIGLNLIDVKLESKSSPEEEHDAVVRENSAFFPLAMPLLAGPGALTVVLEESSHLRAGYWSDLLSATIAIALACFVTWIVLDKAFYIQKVLGKSGTNAITRIMGFILVCIAAQMTIVGIQGVIASVTNVPTPLPPIVSISAAVSILPWLTNISI
ncbi:MAG: MarC family protein [Phycisphaerales bacterium]|nr:MarC family protein [Phycisphaerales bacterium]